MIILGIDPGIAICGLAVIKSESNRQNLIFARAITTPKNSPQPQRLLHLHEETVKVIKKYKPDACVVEKLFFNTNAKTALFVGEARGAILLAICQCGIPFFEYTPLQIKIALTGYGRADKKQMQSLVGQILKLKKTLSPDDVADAAAAALTHGFSYKMAKLTR